MRISIKPRRPLTPQCIRIGAPVESFIHAASSRLQMNSGASRARRPILVLPTSAFPPSISSMNEATPTTHNLVLAHVD